MRKIIGILTICMMVGALGALEHAKAPDAKKVSYIEASTDNYEPPSGPFITPADVIEPNAPDIRALLGTPGKNMAYKTPDTLVCITGEYSGDPTNFFNGVKAYYSFDAGVTWSPFYLSTSVVRRIYPGVIWPDVAGRTWTGSPSPLFFWQEAYVSGGAYQPSPVFIAWDVLWPLGIFNVIELPNSVNRDVWLPSGDAKGDTIIVGACNIFTDLYNYYWLSYDGGNSWVVAGDTWLEPGISGPIPRIGQTPGYMCALGNVYDDVHYPWGAYVPYFGESMDAGQTWTWYSLWDLAHGGNAPYDSCAGVWWYTYDIVLGEGDLPLIVVKYGKGNLEFGDVWFYKPTSGGPGNWQNWTHQLLAGNGNGDPIATQPTISIDPISKNIFINYIAYFIVGTDTNRHVGFFQSADYGNTWVRDTIWPGFDAIEEEAPELPVYSPSDAGVSNLHIPWCDYNFNTPTDTIFHSVFPVTVGIKETSYKPSFKSVTLVLKNTGKEVIIRFALPHEGNVSLSLYNATGRKVAELYKGSALSRTITYKVDGLADGVYFIKLNSSAGNKTAKFILTK